MARLGSVLGAIVAELVQARVIADRLTRDLVEEYETDPVLAAMNVPRVTIGEANITVRYAVDDVEEPVSPEPDFAKARTDLNDRIKASLLPSALKRLNLDSDTVKSVLPLFSRAARAPSAAVLKSAATGNRESAIKATAQPLLAVFDQLPAATRRKLGSRTAFQESIQKTADLEIGKVLSRTQRGAAIQAALNSRIQVAVKRDELPADPSMIQEISLTIRGDDLDLLLAEKGDGDGG